MLSLLSRPTHTQVKVVRTKAKEDMISDREKDMRGHYTIPSGMKVGILKKLSEGVLRRIPLLRPSRPKSSDVPHEVQQSLTEVRRGFQCCS